MTNCIGGCDDFLELQVENEKLKKQGDALARACWSVVIENPTIFKGWIGEDSWLCAFCSAHAGSLSEVQHQDKCPYTLAKLALATLTQRR
jgi:hypothetical protein